LELAVGQFTSKKDGGKGSYCYKETPTIHHRPPGAHQRDELEAFTKLVAHENVVDKKNMFANEIQDYLELI
jgi:hypothetical protein